MEKPEADAGEDKVAIQWTSSSQAFRLSDHRLPPWVKIPRPGPYAGRRDRAMFKEWAFKVENYMELYDVPRELQVVTALSFVEGSPVMWWINREAAVRAGKQPPITDFHVLVKELGDYFAPEYLDEIAEREARNRLANLKQTGSVKEYLDEFLNLLLEIPNMAESEKIYNFISGLKEEVTRHLRLFTKKLSFPEVTCAAERFDSIMSSYGDLSPGRDQQQDPVRRGYRRTNFRRRG